MSKEKTGKNAHIFYGIKDNETFEEKVAKTIVENTTFGKYGENNMFVISKSTRNVKSVSQIHPLHDNVGRKFRNKLTNVTVEIIGLMGYHTTDGIKYLFVIDSEKLFTTKKTSLDFFDNKEKWEEIK